MKIKSFLGGYDNNLSYLVWCDKTKIAAIIDPSVEINPMIELIETNDLILDKIFITHTHYDHISYLKDFNYLFNNAQVLVSQNTSGISFNFKKLSNNEIVAIGEQMIICLDTPGHYHDSMCFWNKKSKSLFTGDTMFVGRTGRTISKTSNIRQLYNSVYDVLLNLPLDTIIYPGHHYGYTKSISIKDNIILSKFFSCTLFEEFQKVMNNFEANR